MRVSGNFNADDFSERIEKSIEDIKREFKDNTDEAAQIMREIIQTSGRPTSKGPGRIRSGAMLEGVNSRVDAETETTINTSFGWDLEDFDRPYPFYQDNGFTHVPDGAWIPGMHALQDARSEFQIRLRNLLKDFNI